MFGKWPSDHRRSCCGLDRSHRVRIAWPARGPRSCPRHRQGGPRSITRCRELACKIQRPRLTASMASRVYRPCFSACSCCRAVRSIPAHHHAFGNAFFRSPPETCRACPTAFWPHSAGSTASDLYDAGVIDPSSFGPRRKSASDQAPDPAGASTLQAQAKALCAIFASPVMPSERPRGKLRVFNAPSWRDNTPPLLSRRSPVRSLGLSRLSSRG